MEYGRNAVGVPECFMRLEPRKLEPPSSVAAVDTVFLVHLIEKVIDAVTLLVPEGSMLPKSRMPGGVVTLHLPTTVADRLTVFEPAACAAIPGRATQMKSAARKHAFMPRILPQRVTGLR